MKTKKLNKPLIVESCLIHDPVNDANNLHIVILHTKIFCNVIYTKMSRDSSVKIEIPQN